MRTKLVRKQRSLATVVITTIATMIMSLLGTSIANAAPNISWIDTTADTVLTIHKFEQPDQMGAPATGLPQNTSGMVPVVGAKFQATLVPGINITTNNGWDAAAEMTPAEAKTLIGQTSPSASGVTDATGSVALDLKVGLYYIEETHVPAGVVAADPFLVVLPIPHPTADEWLYSVHIYPKNPRVTIKLDVIDEDPLTVGDIVKWRSKSTIPNGGETDAYVVQNLINPKLKLTDKASDIVVELTGQNLIPGEDYEVEIITLEGKETIEVVFTEKGREKLNKARQNHPEAQVEISYNTRVLEQGEIVNEARVLPDQRAIDGLTDPVIDDNVTKFGPIKIKVHEKGVPSHLIPNSKFKLYRTAEDANAGRNPIVIDGVSEWETDEDGMITIDGLRFSDFVNGLNIDQNDPRFQYYYAMPISYPPGWTGDRSPIQGSVKSVDEPEVLIAVVWKPEETPPPSPPKPPLSETGGQIGLALGLGALLMLGGASALVFGRKKNREKDLK